MSVPSLQDLAHAVGSTLISSVQVGFQAVAWLGDGYLTTWTAATPPNWQRLTNPQIQDIGELMAATGWSLAWTPPPDVLQKLLQTPGRSDREALLLAAEPRILDDLDRLLRTLDATPFTDLRRACRQALEAYRGGLPVPAQATATAALGQIAEEHLGYQKLDAARKDIEGVDPDAVLPHLVRRMALRAALATAIQGFDNRKARQPEQPYNRIAPPTA